MSNISWASAVSGLYNVATNWTGGVEPGAGDTAILGVLNGSNYTVTAQGETANGIQTAANATLAIAASQTFQASTGTNGGLNAGTISVGDGAIFYVGGTIDNTGKITLNSVSSTTELRILGNGTTTLTGAGSVVLGATGTNEIFSNSGPGTLDNVNNTISGVGTIGAGQMALINGTAGTIDANQTGQLLLDPNGGTYNDGLLEATNTGGLLIDSAFVDNRGNSDAGQITATGAGAHVDLEATTIYGGTLTAGTGAQIDIAASQQVTLDGAFPGGQTNFATGTAFNIDNNAILYGLGTFNNQGTITLDGTANTTELRVDSPVLTLTGGGNLTLGGSGDNFIFGNNGSTNELDNVNNIISGGGNIGDGELTLVNGSLGTIDATASTGLTLQVNNGVTNTGLIEATTGPLLILSTSIDDSQNTNAGLITASGANAQVDLENSTIYGGTLTSTGTGASIDVLASQQAFLDGTGSSAPVNIVAGTNVDVQNNSILYLRGVINNLGTINLTSAANNSEIRLNSPLITLEGNGTIALGGAANDYIFANDSSTETLDNVSNKIVGYGNVGDGEITLENQKKGVIDANTAAGTLTIQVNDGLLNDGTVEATVVSGSGGTLLIYNTEVNGQGGGKVSAVGTTSVAATVELEGAYIYGGTLSSTDKGSIQVLASQIATLDGTAKAVAFTGTLDNLNNSTLYLDGVISNKGTINIEAGANNSDVRTNSAQVTLSGTGKVILSTTGAGAARIYANSNAEQLINDGDTIEGAGNIGAGTNLQLINESTVNANNAAGALTIQETANVENTGLIESTAAGGLLILNSNIDNTGTNSHAVVNSGNMTASGTGHIDLDNSNIYGGTLASTGSGYFDVAAGDAAGLDGAVGSQPVVITAGTNFDNLNNSTLYLYGTIQNSGSINDEAAANNADIRLNSADVVLSGGGNLVLSQSGAGAARIFENQANCLLDNVSNTISGTGQIGAGDQMFLTNETGGTINASAAGGIAINLGGEEVSNLGTLEATAGPLTVANAVFNSGNIIANGGNITISGGVEGTGNMALDAASSLTINSSWGTDSDQTVTFGAGATGVFTIEQAQYFNGTIANFTGAGTQGIDLANLSFSTASFTYSGTATTGTLTVTDGTNTAVLNLTGGTSFSQAYFQLKNDGGGHVLVQDPPPHAKAHALVAAMAGFGASHNGSSSTSSVAAPAGQALLVSSPH